MLSFLMLLTYLRFINTEKIIFYFISLAIFILGLFTMELSIVLPFIIFFVDRVFIIRRNLINSAKRVLPFLILTLVYIIFYYIFFYKTLPYYRPNLLNNIISLNFMSYLFNSFIDVILGILTFSRDGNFLIYKSTFGNINILINFLQIILVLSLIYILYILIKDFFQKKKIYINSKIFLFCIIWFLLNSILPSIFGEKSIGDIFVIPYSRYYYLPTACFAILVGILFFNILKKSKFAYILLFCIILINSLYIFKIEKGYELIGKNNFELINFIGKVCKGFSPKDTLYLINFPEGYKMIYNFFLSDLINIYYGKDINLIWLDEKDVNKKVFKGKDKRYFIKFKDKHIFDATEYFARKLRVEN